MESFIIIAIVLIVVAFLLIGTSTHYSSDKGKEGENTVAFIALSAVNHGLYGRVLQNVYIPKGDGSTTELDVVFVSIKGIFVFESKNFAGYIFGDDKQRNWTVSLYAGKDWLGAKHTEKHQFYNPVWQNKTHIKASR